MVQRSTALLAATLEKQIERMDEALREAAETSGALARRVLEEGAPAEAVSAAETLATVLGKHQAVFREARAVSREVVRLLSREAG